MLRIKVNGVLRYLRATVVIERFAGVRVHIEPRKVAAGDVQPNPVSPLENERRRVHLDGELVWLAALQKLRLTEAIAVTRPHNAIGDIEIHAGRKIGGGRIHIHEFGREIGIESV